MKRNMFWIVVLVVAAALIFGPDKVIEFFKAIPLFIWIILGVALVFSLLIAYGNSRLIKKVTTNVVIENAEIKAGQDFVANLIEEDRERRIAQNGHDN